MRADRNLILKPAESKALNSACSLALSMHFSGMLTAGNRGEEYLDVSAQGVRIDVFAPHTGFYAPLRHRGAY
jgi:hypothetical protein